MLLNVIQIVIIKICKTKGGENMKKSLSCKKDKANKENTLTFRLTATEHKMIVDKSKELNLSFSAIIRLALKEFIQNH